MSEEKQSTIPERTIAEVNSRDAERNNLIDKVFGGATPAPSSKIPQPVKVFTEDEKKKSFLNEKHLKLKKQIINVFEENGYNMSDDNVAAIVGNLMSNIARLRY